MQGQTVSSIDDLLLKISALKWKYQWYRGVHDVRYDLEPSIYRPNKNGQRHGRDNEKRICDRFHDRISQLIHRSSGDLINILILMQHYGLPTRLLDWTDSLAVALSFAMERDSQQPVIWVLNPFALNAMNSPQYRDGLPQSHDFPAVNDYARLAFLGTGKPNKSTSHYGAGILPLAFKPFYPDLRLYIQRSRLTIHGLKTDPLNSQLAAYELTGNTNERPIDNVLKKYVLAFDPEMKMALRALKLNNAILYPDREGLVRRLQYELENELKFSLSANSIGAEK